MTTIDSTTDQPTNVKRSQPYHLRLLASVAAFDLSTTDGLTNARSIIGFANGTDVPPKDCGTVIDALTELQTKTEKLSSQIARDLYNDVDQLIAFLEPLTQKGNGTGEHADSGADVGAVIAAGTAEQQSGEGEIART